MQIQCWYCPGGGKHPAIAVHRINGCEVELCATHAAEYPDGFRDDTSRSQWNGSSDDEQKKIDAQLASDMAN